MAERKLAAIMFTDISGYTALMGSDEQKALEYLQKNRDLQKPLIESHNGKYLKEMGDGLMAQFDSAFDAVACAVQIQVQAGDLSGKIRIGIHLGDVTADGNDIFGDGVNIASRLEPVAEPGGICVSETIQKTLRSRNEFTWMSLGDLTLKNVDYPVSAYCLTNDGLNTPRPSKIQAYKPSRKETIDVPLENINDALIQQVFDELVKVKPSVGRILMTYDEDEDEEEPDIRELADLIVRNFPWIIGVELRRLFSGSLRVLNRKRLSQIIFSSHRALQFLSFFLLIELFERVSDGQMNVNGTFTGDLKNRFASLEINDFAWIISQIQKLFAENKVDRFITDIDKFLDEEFVGVLNTEFPSRDVDGKYGETISDDDVAKMCFDYQEKLGIILKKISFITNYRLVTIKEIRVLKHRHRKAMFEHMIDILSSTDSDFRSKQETFNSYSDSNAVLLMKSLKKPDEYLNLSPLIIDIRGEVMDSREKFDLKKDIFICEGYANGKIRYLGTKITEDCDLSSVSNYEMLLSDMEQIVSLEPKAETT